MIYCGLEKTVTYCDLCGKVASCVQKEIDGKEFDLCNSCWEPLAARLTGKGRTQQARQELEEYDEISTY